MLSWLGNRMDFCSKLHATSSLLGMDKKSSINRVRMLIENLKDRLLQFSMSFSRPVWRENDGNMIFENKFSNKYLKKAHILKTTIRSWKHEKAPGKGHGNS